MSPFDLVLTGGTLVTSARTFAGTLGVRDGRIAAVLGPGERPPARETMEVKGLHVLPGLIDTHVHTRHPGAPDREDFRSGTAAAAAGGITTLFEMPISKTPANSADALRRRVEAMAPEAHIDFALYGGAGHENLDAIEGQAEAGAIAFKTFLVPPPPNRLDEFFGLWCTDEARLPEVMAAVERTGLRHCFHCEDPAVIAAQEARLEAAGQRRGRAHAESRPLEAEERSVAMVLRLADEVGARVGVVHMSSPRAAAMVRDARAKGLDVTAETCPPYLFFSDEALERLGPYAKCNPPLRAKSDVEGLWSAIQQGIVDYVGTDHSPFLARDKDRGLEDIFQAPPGLCGLEVLGPLMLTAVNTGRLALPQLVSLVSERAAEVFGLPAKGRLAEGADADLVVVDLAARWQYDSAHAFTKSAANMAIYDAFDMRGRIVSTIVRGVRVFHKGEIVGPPGHGRFLRPA